MTDPRFQTLLCGLPVCVDPNMPEDVIEIRSGSDVVGRITFSPDYKQPSLFADPPVCPACGARAKATCRHTANVRLGVVEATAARPKGCLGSQVGRDDPGPEGMF